MRVLIAPVGEQPTPNLIPLFAAQPEGRAQCVQFLISDKERIKEVAENLRKALTKDPEMQAGGLTVVEPLMMDAWNLEKARSACANAIKKYSGDDIMVNLTGGTKIMSLAAFQAAVEARVPMLYVNTERDELIRFSGGGEPLAPESFTVKISIETQLRAAGQEFKKHSRPIQRIDSLPIDRADFVKWLVGNYSGAYEVCLKRIVIQARDEARKAQRKPWQHEVHLAFEPRGKGFEALQRLEAMGLLTWKAAQRLLRVADEPSWRFLDGGWVETYALVSLTESGLFDEVLGNLEVEDFEGEIDIVVTRNGRLGIVECKTKGPHGEGVTFAAAKLRQHEAIFGGPYARAVFALASDEHISDIGKVAEQYGIKEPIYGEDLKDLARKAYKGLSP